MSGGPTFLVIGAQKAGTTWLARMLSQHPEVGVARQKELHFFDKRERYRRGLAWYESQFPARTDGIAAVGEFTPNYLWAVAGPEERRESGLNADIPRLVHEAYPELRLVVTLRDPVSRAVSAYFHLLGAGYLPHSASILEVGDRRGIISMGYYAQHLREWLRYFPLDRFLFLVYEEDLVEGRKSETLRRTFRHIGVAEDFEPEGMFGRYNPRASYLEMRYGLTNTIRGKLIRRMVPERIKNHPRLAVTVSEQEKVELRRLYQPHNRDLESLLQRRLPW